MVSLRPLSALPGRCHAVVIMVSSDELLVTSVCCSSLKDIQSLTFAPRFAS